MLRTSVDEGEELPDAWGQPVLKVLAARLFEPGARAIQETFQTDDGRAYSIAGIPPRGRSKNVILVVTDVSVRERRERAEREFVTNAAHELRTPLATITGAIQVLQSGAKDDPAERDRFLDHIEREAARLCRLTNSLLVLARAQTREEAPKLAPVELQPLLEAIAEDVQPPKEVAVTVSCPSGLEVLAERDLVEQAVSNLAANALQNTERGKVEIVARELPGGSVALEVTDTGNGIAPERQDRIFDRFYRPDGRDPRRFGLGLAIVRQAVAALGGHRRARVGRRRRDDRAYYLGGRAEGGRRVSRVLIVDDDPGIVDVVSYALRNEGFEVEGVASGGRPSPRPVPIRMT